MRKDKKIPQIVDLSEMVANIVLGLNIDFCGVSFQN